MSRTSKSSDAGTGEVVLGSLGKTNILLVKRGLLRSIKSEVETWVRKRCTQITKTVTLELKVNWEAN